MSFNNTRAIPIRLANDEVVKVEATLLDSSQDVLDIADALQFDTVIAGIEGLSAMFASTLRKVSPQKATIELGVEVGFEAGKLVALFAQGTGKGNMKITLEWSEGNEKES